MTIPHLVAWVDNYCRHYGSWARVTTWEKAPDIKTWGHQLTFWLSESLPNDQHLEIETKLRGLVAELSWNTCTIRLLEDR